MMHKIDKEKLRKLYANQNLSVEDIAARLGCNRGTVSRLASKYGFPLRSQAQRKDTEERRELLRELYPDKTITIRQIAKKLGCSQNTVHLMRKDMGLPPRGPMEKSQSPPKKELEELAGRFDTTVDIAYVLNAHPYTVSQWLRRHGIIVGKMGSPQASIDPDEVRKYIGMGLTVADTASIIGASLRGVSMCMKRNGIAAANPRRVTREDAESAVAEIRDKRCLKDAAEACGIASSTCKNRIRAGISLGLMTAEEYVSLVEPNRTRPVTDEDARHAAHAWKRYGSLRSVAEVLCCGRGTARRRLDRARELGLLSESEPSAPSAPAPAHRNSVASTP